MIVRPEYLECAVCCDLYNTPICLECGHCFCLNCVLRVQEMSKANGNKKHSECPLCKTKFKHRRSWFYKPCIPISNMVSCLRAQLNKKIEFKFELDLDSIPEDILKSLP